MFNVYTTIDWKQSSMNMFADRLTPMSNNRMKMRFCKENIKPGHSLLISSKIARYSKQTVNNGDPPTAPKKRNFSNSLSLFLRKVIPFYNRC